MNLHISKVATSIVNIFAKGDVLRDGLKPQKYSFVKVLLSFSEHHAKHIPKSNKQKGLILTATYKYIYYYIYNLILDLY